MPPKIPPLRFQCPIKHSASGFFPLVLCCEKFDTLHGKAVNHEPVNHCSIHYAIPGRRTHYGYRLQRQSIRRLVLVPPYFVFCSISFRYGGLSIERNQKPLTSENTLALTHHDKQKQVEVKRSSRANPHEFRLFSGCPYAVVKQGTKKFTKK